MREIRRVTSQQADEIIETLKPLGLFYVCKDDGTYTAIDNSCRHAWTEDFENINDCIDYLLGENIDNIRKRESKRKEVLYDLTC